MKDKNKIIIQRTYSIEYNVFEENKKTRILDNQNVVL